MAHIDFGELEALAGPLRDFVEAAERVVAVDEKLHRQHKEFRLGDRGERKCVLFRHLMLLVQKGVRDEDLADIRLALQHLGVQVEFCEEKT